MTSAADSRIYLDYNASTPLAPSVAAKMREVMEDAFGNPSSLHWAGAPARVHVEHARAQVAELLGCEPREVVFTSGGSEANNLALKGVFFARAGEVESPHVITTAVEHPAIVALIYLAVALLFYAPIVFGIRTFPDGDFTHHFLPFSLFQQQSLLA